MARQLSFEVTPSMAAALIRSIYRNAEKEESALSHEPVNNLLAQLSFAKKSKDLTLILSDFEVANWLRNGMIDRSWEGVTMREIIDDEAEGLKFIQGVVDKAYREDGFSGPRMSREKNEDGSEPRIDIFDFFGQANESRERGPFRVTDSIYRRSGTMREKKDMTSLKEFFVHKLHEGPQDPAFKAAPAIERAPSLNGDGSTGDGTEGMLPQAEPEITQNVSAGDRSDLDFFSKNVRSAVSKLSLDGFDSGTLVSLAQALDSYVYSLYQGVADPQARVDFEAEYQKSAADWSKDIVKFFDKVKKLEGHAH